MLDQYGGKGATNLDTVITNLLGEDLSVFTVPIKALCLQRINKVSEVLAQLKLNQYTGISPLRQPEKAGRKHTEA